MPTERDILGVRERERERERESESELRESQEEIVRNKKNVWPFCICNTKQ